MASTYISGTSGGVKVDGSLVASFKSWSLNQTTADLSVANFGSTVDANLRVWPDYLPGLSGATGTADGWFLIGAGTPSDSTITSGTYHALVLEFSKLLPWGFAVNVLVTGFTAQVNVENQPSSFSIQFRVTGTVPLSSAV